MHAKLLLVSLLTIAAVTAQAADTTPPTSEQAAASTPALSVLLAEQAKGYQQQAAKIDDAIGKTTAQLDQLKAQRQQLTGAIAAIQRALAEDKAAQATPTPVGVESRS